jgi:two-component system, OmpR family, sensor kinase
VKRIVDGLGGSIALENISGANRSGLCVTIRLPIAADLRSAGRGSEATTLS